MSLSPWTGVGHSVGPGVILLWLLRRAITHAGGRLDLLFLHGVRGFSQLKWTWPYFIAVGLACALMVWRRDRAGLVRVQWFALGGGLLLTQYGLGGEIGAKVDPRFVFAILAGVASLYSCYACLVAHSVIWLLSRTRPSDGITRASTSLDQE